MARIIKGSSSKVHSFVVSGQAAITYVRVTSELTKGLTMPTHMPASTHTLIESLWLALPTLSLKRGGLVGELAYPTSSLPLASPSTQGTLNALLVCI